MASSARIDELRKKFDENPRRYFAPLANEYRKSGDAEQAIFICQEYLPQQPGHMSGHIVYGQALYELNRHDEARAVFETALSLDPENLIALRHLGDIARLSGDTTTARVWYQRVLEADPRNEEIAQIMLSLLSADAAVASSADTVAATPPTNAPVSTAEAADAELAQLASEVSVPPVEAISDGDARKEPLSPHAPTEAELLDLDDFDLGGIPLSELRAASPTPTYQPEQPLDEGSASGIELPPMIDAHDEPPVADETEDEAFAAEQSEAEHSEFEADPFAVASASFDNDLDNDRDNEIQNDLDRHDESPTAAAASDESLDGTFDSSFDGSADASADAFEPGFATSAEAFEPPIELATDLHLGLENDQPTEAATPSSATMDGLETFEAGVFNAELPATSSIETESFFENVENLASDVVEAPRAADASSDGDTGDGDTDAADGAPHVDDAEPVVASDVAVDVTADFTENVAADFTGEVVGASDESDSAPPAETFVTETMAELYLEQGHLEAALEIYQRLIDQRPEDSSLFTRMQALQDRIDARAATPPVDAEAAAAVAPARSFGGPTIREFLSELARKTPGGVTVSDDTWQASQGVYADRSGDPYAVDPYAGDDLSAYRGTPAPYDGIDEPFSSNTPLVDEALDAPLDVPLDAPLDEFNGLDTLDLDRDLESQTSSSVSETVGDSLGALFSGADAAAADTAAAHTLAEAFAAEGPETASLEGLPAHRATSELSLDHVFKGNTAPKPAGDADGFSFDQFFADEAADGAAETSRDTPASGAQGADDIAQFNAWLNGLKKT